MLSQLKKTGIGRKNFCAGLIITILFSMLSTVIIGDIGDKSPTWGFVAAQLAIFAIISALSIFRLVNIGLKCSEATILTLILSISSISSMVMSMHKSLHLGFGVTLVATYAFVVFLITAPTMFSSILKYDKKGMRYLIILAIYGAIFIMGVLAAVD